MKNLMEIIKGIFDSDKAQTNADGQRVITVDALAPELEGLKLFDDEPGEPGEPDAATEPVIPTIPEIDMTQIVTKQDLTDLINRLIALEQLVTAVDTVQNTEPGGATEIW